MFDCSEYCVFRGVDISMLILGLTLLLASSFFDIHFMCYSSIQFLKFPWYLVSGKTEE